MLLVLFQFRCVQTRRHWSSSTKKLIAPVIALMCHFIGLAEDHPHLGLLLLSLSLPGLRRIRSNKTFLKSMLRHSVTGNSAPITQF